MQEEFSNFNHDEQLKAENDFLKMKIMLENGGHFGGIENSQLPPEIENQFLNNVLAFEQQFDQCKTIKIFEKIGKPTHFRAVSEIPDAAIDEEWDALQSYMSEYGVRLDVCSPNISNKELYRFVTEELFQEETDDMDLPGWTTNYIYDEFHPDPVYDNSRLVEQDLFMDLFSKRDLFYEVHYANDGFVFNGQEYNNFSTFNEKVARFKSLFSEIELGECIINCCSVGDRDCHVEGNYKVLAKAEKHEIAFSGSFDIQLIMQDPEYWYFKKIDIEGFQLE